MKPLETGRWRQSTRLRGWDYRWQGAYFITVCAYQRNCLFGEIMNGEMWANAHGDLVRTAWQDLPNHHGEMILDEFALMPNHIHGILFITKGFTEANQRTTRPEPPGFEHPTGPSSGSLSVIVGGFKSSATRAINRARACPGTPVWQRGFHDRIIRDDEELRRIRTYIRDNPRRWHLDPENPAGTDGKQDP